MIRGVALLAGLLFFLGWLPPTPAAIASSSRIKPIAHAGEIEIKIGQKRSGYHRMTKQTPIVFPVKGPIPVRLLSRILPDSSLLDGPIPYGICVEIDGVRLPLVEEIATISTAAVLAGGGRVGTLEREILYIPRGRHKVWLFPEEDSVEIAVRLFRGEGKRADQRREEETWADLIPKRHAGAIRLQSDGKEWTYYRLRQPDPIEGTLSGPARIQIETRADFLPGGETTLSYRIEVDLDGELLDSHSYEAEPEPSARSVYPELRGVIPGKRKETRVFQIPDGSHSVRISLLETTATGVAVRILVSRSNASKI